MDNHRTYTLLRDGAFVQNHTPGAYAGNAPRKIFGRLDCASGERLMKRENRVFFATIEDAVREGYRPCMKCKPLDEEDFERVRHLVPYATLDDFYGRDGRDGARDGKKRGGA